MMFQEKWNLQRRERRFLQKIQSFKVYKKIVELIYSIFNLNKKFLVLKWKSYKKILWIISITSFYFLWRKIWFIDDFIVNRKLRWKWIWKKIFSSTINKLDQENNRYIFLLSRKDRRASHWLYKKFWFSIIALWFWIFAYKKFNKNKKKF
jgi:hypothetical protein